MKENKLVYTLLLISVTYISTGYFRNVFEIVKPSEKSRVVFIVLSCLYLIVTFPKNYEYRPVKVFKDSIDELSYLDKE